jgi:hypothetical protein
LAERTGLEPATPGVTGRYSNQLNYRSLLHSCILHFPKSCAASLQRIVHFLVGADGIEPPTFAV